MLFDTRTTSPSFTFKTDNLFLEIDRVAKTGLYVRYPEQFGVSHIRFDAIDDGSFPADIDLATSPSGEFRYKLTFFYPFSTRLHAWMVDHLGVRRESIDYSVAEAEKFFEARPTSIGCLARLLMLPAEPPRDIIARSIHALLQNHTEASFCAAELAVALLDRDVEGWVVDRALDLLQRFSLELVKTLASYRNGRCLSARARPIIASVARREAAASEVVKDAVFKLDCSTRPWVVADHGTPLPPPTLVTDRPGDQEKLKFSFRYGEGHSLVVEAGHPKLDLLRVTSPIRFLRDLIGDYMLRDNVVDFARAKFGLKQSSQLSAVIQVGDSFVDVSSLAYGARDGYHHVASVPDPYFVESMGFDTMRKSANNNWVDWKDRRDKVFWRGQTTGLDHLTRDSIARLPRFQLCKIALEVPNTDCRIMSIVQAAPGAKDALQAYCQAAGVWGEWVAEVDQMQYRYLVDIDGNVNSWGFFSKLITGSCVLKVASPSGWRQWFYSDLEPWTHYIPVLSDLSDFQEKVSWCHQNEDECQRIGREGRLFTLRRTYESEMTLSAKKLLSLVAGVPIP